MRSLTKSSLLGLGAALALAVSTSSQTLSSVTPEAATPGDLVILSGSGLGGVTRVDFTGNVGGFTFQLTQTVTPLSVTPTEVRAICPGIGGFIGPCSFQGSDPVGFVSTDATPGMSLPFFFMEETTTDPPGGPPGALVTVGQGSTQPSGERAIGSFALPGGPPTSGNATYTPKVVNATPGQFAFLAIGPAFPAPVPYGDGLLAVDVSSLYVLVSGPPVDSSGVSALNLPLPALCPPSGRCTTDVCGIPAVAQWAVVDPTTGGVFLSNGMAMLL